MTADSFGDAGERVKNREKIEKAIKLQDRLREKTGGWNGEEEIKKWRQKR